MCPGWKRSVHSGAPGVEQMAARENLLGEDVQLFLSSRCHCSQWLLQLGTGGVNWVWFRLCWGCSPFVPSTVLAFVLGHQLAPVERPLLTPFSPKNYREILYPLQLGVEDSWPGLGWGGMGWTGGGVGGSGYTVKGSF